MSRTEAVALMERVRDYDDEEAFARIVRAFTTSLTRHLTKRTRRVEIAEELVQETFIRLWTRRKRYVPRAELATFVFFIANRLVMNWFRAQIGNGKTRGKRYGRSEPLDLVAHVLVDPQPGPETIVADREELARVVHAAADLSPRRREGVLGRIRVELGEVVVLPHKATVWHGFNALRVAGIREGIR